MTSFWIRHRITLVNAFIISNLAFLAVDIYFAHSINKFHEIAEWIPFIFSLSAAPILTVCLFLYSKGISKNLARNISKGTAYVSIFIGILGLIFHLKGHFFEGMSIKTLVYAAPFMAPLAYSGLGFLILLNWKVDAQQKEWGQWIVFFALGGFFGNFILSLCDHAQNGFFYLTEWIPVAMSALAVGFLSVSLLVKASRNFLNVTLCVLLLQVAVGILGFYLHFKANISYDSDDIFQNFVFGAPIFAPLLFADLAVLAMMGVYDLKQRVTCEK